MGFLFFFLIISVLKCFLSFGLKVLLLFELLMSFVLGFLLMVIILFEFGMRLVNLLVVKMNLFVGLSGLVLGGIFL